MGHWVLLLLLVTVFFGVPSAVAAQQTDGPYVVGGAGGVFGDVTGSFSVGFGYLTPRRVGLEGHAFLVAFGVGTAAAADRDLASTGRHCGVPRAPVERPVSLLTLQTNIIGVLPASGTRLRAFVEAGGGIADQNRRLHIEQSVPVVPPLSELFTNPPPSLTFTTL
jgi:hypothetical protein